MNEITKSTRVETTLRVIQRMNEGLTVKEACLEVGMPRSTFYNILARDHEVIAIFQDMVVASDREKLWFILANQTAVLQQVIQDALAKTTKPRERLAIYKTLQETLDELSEKLRMSQNEDTVLAELLTGPLLVPGISRFVSGSG